MVDVKNALVLLSDEIWERTRHRLDGLTDAEYLWEPAPGCWSIRERPNGEWRTDWSVPHPDPPPFTTIGWRLWHLIDMYGEDRSHRWLAVEPHGPAIGLDDPTAEPPSTAADALALLDRAHERWDAHLAQASDESLGRLIGDVGGFYGDRARTSYVLHMLDEFVHHGAEIALLRDLWRWQHPLGVDSLSDRAMRGDVTVLDEIDGLDEESASELMRTAAAYGRWELVSALVAADVPIPAVGRTPLHMAAGTGELDVVRLLVERGADTHAEDQDFHAPAIQWARYFHHDHVVSWLEARDAH